MNQDTNPSVSAQLLRLCGATCLGYIALTLLLALFVPNANAVSSDRQQQLIYLLHQDCGSCHGMTLKGGLGPAIRKADLQDKGVEFIRQTIAKGRPNTAMPPWENQLSREDIDFLARYLLSEANNSQVAP